MGMKERQKQLDFIYLFNSVTNFKPIASVNEGECFIFAEFSKDEKGKDKVKAHRATISCFLFKSSSPAGMKAQLLDESREITVKPEDMKLIYFLPKKYANIPTAIKKVKIKNKHNLNFKENDRIVLEVKQIFSKSDEIYCKIIMDQKGTIHSD